MLVAFGAGILSFLSPCVLPLVPGYLSMVSGLSAAELSATAPGNAAASITRPMLTGIALFVGGFTVVFVALGAAASGIGHLLDSHEVPLAHLSGLVVIVLGLLLVVGALPGEWWSHLGGVPLRFLTRINGERRFDVRPSTLGAWAAPVMGMAFAFAWTPCIGPVLGVVLGLAARDASLAGGVLLLFAYSLGLGVPFVITGLAFGRLTAMFARARRSLSIVEAVAGLVLVVFGILLLTDNVAWVSTQFSHLLDHIGLSRLTRS
ncbi:MAG: cytochrome c biogenesis CcdA family protein [Acidimicrobiales bacterium]